MKLALILPGLVAAPGLTAFVPDSYVEKTVAEIFAPQSAPEGCLAHVGAALTLRRASLRADARQRANLPEEIEALHRRHDEIAVPVEIVHGSADTTVGLSIHSEPLARQVAGARLDVIEGAGLRPAS